MDHDESASAVLHGHTMTEDEFFKELKNENSEFYDVQLAKESFSDENATIEKAAYSELIHRYLSNVLRDGTAE